MQSVTRQQQGTAFVLEITPRHRHRRVSAKFALLSKGESLNHIKCSINIRDHVPGEDDDDDCPMHPPLLQISTPYRMATNSQFFHSGCPSFLLPSS